MLFWALCGGATLVTLAAFAEAYIRRNRTRRRLAETRPDMPKAKSNLGFGFEKEWRPKMPTDTGKDIAKRN